MARFLKKGDVGVDVSELQTLLMQRGFLTNEEITGIFDNATYQATRVFQSQNLDKHGQPLVVDGKVGELTWWSLKNPKHTSTEQTGIDFTIMPPLSAGGSQRGRAALQTAINEIKAGAGEIGGNNMGPFVKKYLHGIVPEGNPWCAGFVSFCFSQHAAGMPYPYTVGARNILREFQKRNWAFKPNTGYLPKPGDIVVWWREQPNSGKGHIGLVYQVKDGFLYTIEGNRSTKVQGFSYVLSRMDKLLGYGQVPD